MRVGTKSILFGVHQFLLHPAFLWEAWRRLYGVPLDPRLYVAFAVHDLGYLFRRDMDGLDSERHVELGANITQALFGPSWGKFCGCHSRYYARSRGLQISRLCVADKLAFVLMPSWLYLPLARSTGELDEYMTKSRERQAGCSAFTEQERAQIESGDARLWLRGLQSYTRRWVEQHRNGGADTWTVVADGSGALLASSGGRSKGHRAE
jgi:hypothetical protein